MRYLLPILLLSALASAETRTYVVLREEHFPQDRYLHSISPQEYKKFVDIGKHTLDEAGGQPFRITSYELNYSGKYAVWRVQYANESEKNDIDNLASKKYILLVSSSEVVSIYKPSIGGSELEVDLFENLTNYPTDFYEIVGSTP